MSFDPEQAKLLAIGLAALATKVSATIAATSGAEGIDKWIERGGTVTCIAILGYMLKQERDERKERQKQADDERKERQKQFDDLMQQDRSIHTASTEARIRLSDTMDRQCSALDKLTETIDRLKS